MKIKRLCFENINSLAGTWEIDFTDPAFNDGIFILTGPTGAGKTSILDAICLGLYGETSRQKSFSAKENEVMTKGCSSCFAQVEFENHGKQYRAFWEHRRKKGYGDFQTRVVRRIYEIAGDSGNEDKVIAESIKDADREIAEILKMDFKQFTSAVLLPQGQFDQFLNANKQVRSEILEKITGARIYSLIGSAVQQRKTKEDDELKSLKRTAETIKPLSAEEEAEILQGIEDTRLLAAEQNQSIEVLHQKLLQCRKFEELHNGIQALEEKVAELKTEEKANADDFSRLERAKKAASLLDLVTSWDQGERERKNVKAEIRAIENALHDLSLEKTELAPRLKTAEEAKGKALQIYTSSVPLVKIIRELSLEFRLKQNRRDQKQAEYEKTKKTADEYSRSLGTEKKNLEALSAQLDGLNNSLQTAEGEYAALAAALTELGKSLQELSAFSSAPSFEETRKKLKEGEVCPLCGSRDHPFCVVDRQEFEKQQEFYRKLHIQHEEAEKKYRQAEAEMEILKDKKNITEKEKAVAEERQNTLHTLLAEAEKTGAGIAGELEDLDGELEKSVAALEEQIRILAPPRVQDFEIGAYEQEIQNDLSVAETELAELQKKYEALEAGRVVHEKNLADKKDRDQVLVEQADRDKTLMEEGFVLKGFADYQDWRRCFWETGRIIEVERKKAELAIHIANAETSLAAKKKETAELPAFPPHEPEKIESELQSLRDTIQQYNQTIGELNNKLAENKKKKIQREEYEKDIAGQVSICSNWKRMDDWIGGKDGWRFKQFAQSITFRQLIHNSQPYLLQMSGGRYELRARTDNDELFPLVIDQHQGSVERVISNLSGGERFLLSLALALGLSRLSSRNLQIDSLFLDEGFGTLDKETLERAINILSGLQQNNGFAAGKLTGIISHVEELRERIGANIQVSKSGGGRSIVSGCGVRQL
jgi:exonuclease SbcC